MSRESWLFLFAGISALAGAIQLILKFIEYLGKSRMNQNGETRRIAPFSWGAAFIVLSLALSFIGFSMSYKASELSTVQKVPVQVQKVPVLFKEFKNENVLVDGKSFSNCSFDNVTFEFNGTAPFDIVNSTIIGSYVLKSNNEVVAGLMEFLKAFKYLNENVKFRNTRIDS